MVSSTLLSLIEKVFVSDLEAQNLAGVDAHVSLILFKLIPTSGLFRAS